MYRLLGIFLVTLLSYPVFGQDYNFGLRAGVNYSTIIGPEHKGNDYTEQFKYRTGIHFAVTFDYYFSDLIALKTELSYNAVGAGYSFESNSAPYVFKNLYEREPRQASISRKYNYSNTYLNIPVMFSIKPLKKLELFAGPYVQFLVNPRVNGTIDVNAPNDELYSFIQNVEGNYYTDRKNDSKSSQTLAVQLVIDESAQTLFMPRTVGPYFEKDADNRPYVMNVVDAGIRFGAAYTANKSLYFMVSGMYGLLDVTSNDADINFYELDDNKRYKLNSDFDQNFGLQLSVGFKF